jgi:uncharacterized protein with beta-barrel porin domain
MPITQFHLPSTSPRLRRSEPFRKPTRVLACSILALCGVALAPTNSAAQTWLNAPATNNWNTAGNWAPANIPDIAGETAIFTNSTVTNPTITGPITIDGITINGATAFTIDNQDVVAIVAAGLANTSGLTQTINNSTLFSELNFENAATVGTGFVINNSGFVNFDDNSSAGVATVNNVVADGILNFLGSATGGNATLVNAGSGVTGSSIIFANTTTAGAATITNSGTNALVLFGGSSQGGTANISNTAAGATTQFSNNASGGTASITNVADDTTVTFTNSASAGGATIVSSGAFSSVSFNDTSTGGTSNITLSGNTAIADFLDNATAGGATINLTNATALLNFFDSASGGTAIINNSASSGTFPSSVVGFFNNSNALNATITNSGQNAQTLFSNNATANAATINNTGTDSNTTFVASATAGTANISNSGSGSSTIFGQTATAGSATIQASGGFSNVRFIQNSSAGTSNITLSGNTAIGDFLDNATASGATINLTNPTALLNFFDATTAGTATINNQANSGTFPSSIVGFFNTSSALNSQINNTGTNSQTLFSDTATASGATIANSGSDSNTTFVASATAGAANISNSGSGSSTIFGQTATAGSATIVSGGGLSNVRFIENSSAGTSNITLSGDTAIGDFLNNATASGATINLTNPTALLNFFDTTNAGTATINNQANSGTFPGAIVGFFNTSSALNSSINNSGTNAQTLFSDTATASGAAIQNSGVDSNTTFIVSASASTSNITNTGTGSSVIFGQNSTAGDSTIVSSGGNSFVRFRDSSTGATSSITLSGSTALGEFLNNSTAGDADITLTNATALLSFFDSSNAGTSSINNQGGGAAPAAIVGFFDNSNAQTSVIVNGGANTQTLFAENSNANGVTVTNSGAGSRTVFSGNATGGSAVLINANPTSGIDISSLLTSSLTIGSFEGNGTLFLGSQTLTAGSNNRDITFSGVIRDGGASGGVGGALVKVGTGTWTLSGTNTFTGGMDIQLGTVVVENPQALGLGNVRLSNGILRGGPALTEIRVGGNYTQTGGELQLRIGGTGNDQHDRLVVAGTANLGGRLKLDTVGGYAPQSGDRVELVTAGGGVNGEFATVQTAAPLVEGQLQYLSNEVVLSFVRTAFEDIAKTPNQKSTARALDQALLNPGGAELLAYLDTLPIDALPDALDRLAPEELGALFSIPRTAAYAQAFTVLHRLDEIRAANRNGMMEPVLGGPAKEMKEVVGEAPRFGAFAHGSGEFINFGGNSNARGYDLDAGGVTIGADYQWSPNFVIGFLANYTRGRIDLNRGGEIESDSVRGGVYASVFGAGGYLTGYLGGGYNDFDTKRDGLGGNAHGQTDGAEFNALIAAGYDAHFGGLTVGPIATYQYTFAKTDAFRERGSLAPLDIHSENHRSSRTNLGIRVAYEIPMGSITITPEVRASWQHEFGDRTFATTAQFGFGGPDFTVTTPDIGRDAFVLNAGFTLQLSPTFGAHAYYHGDFGTSNYDAHLFLLGARVSF